MEPLFRKEDHGLNQNIARYPVRTEATAHRVVGDEALVVNFKDSFFYSLSPLGTLIWEHCDGQHSVAQIVEEIVQQYDVESEEALKDCEDFLKELVEEGILEWRTSPASEKMMQ